MLVTIHRGAREIGGSCVELKAGHGRIVVDMGMPLVDMDGAKFDFRTFEDSLGADLVKQCILPDIPGLYRWDTQGKLVDGLLVSHPHIDHYGFIRCLHPEIPVYLGAGAKKLIDLTVAFTPMEGEINNPSVIKSGEAFSCGGFTVTPYLMDHSAFDAYAFLIEAGGKRLLYSGDFREHGRKPKAFFWFLNNVPNKIDAILLEGTMFGRDGERSVTEADIEKAAVELLKDNARIALAYASSQNIDRLVTLYRAAKRTGRLFVVDIYTANILGDLASHAKIPYPCPDFPDVRVIYPRNLSDRIAEQGLEEKLYRYRPYKITKQEIVDDPSRILMLVKGSMLFDLKIIDKLDPAVLEGSTFIYSMWEGYLGERSMQRMLELVERKKMRFRQLHTSGHADIATLKKVVDKLQPRAVIPIHTLHPERYSSLGFPVQHLNDGEAYEL